MRAKQATQKHHATSHMESTQWLPLNSVGFMVPYLLLLMLVAAPTALFSQVTTATAYGTVTDPSGAALEGASVTLTNEATGVARTQATSETGEFSFQFIDPGVYSLRIEQSGFKSWEGKALEFRSGQNFRSTYALEIGDVTERVVVTAEAPLVNSASAEQRDSVSSLQAQELPVARRTLSNIISLGAGIIPGGNGTFILNGNARKAASITMDGIDASGDQKIPSANTGSAYISVVSLDAVEEVQVVKGVYSAEYSRTLAGNINVITKSGTNQLHGSAFWLFNSDELQARNPFLSTVPGSTFNQFGASVGGPVLKDKLFLFGAYEGYRERSFRAVEGTVPTQRLRDDATNAVPAYGPYLATFPLPNQPTDPGAATGYFIGSGAFQSSDDHFVVRSDWWINNRVQVGVTFVRGRPTSFTPALNLENGQAFEGRADRLSAQLTTVGTLWSTETRIGVNRNGQDTQNGLWDMVDPTQTESSFGNRRYPLFSALGFGVTARIETTGAPQLSFSHKWAVTRGRHSFKFGGNLFAPRMESSNISNPSFRYTDEADLLANRASRADFTFGRSLFRATAKEVGFFIQDDWRVSPRLTLNLGLRWDLFSRWTAESAEHSGEPPYLFNPDGIRDAAFTIGPLRSPDDAYERDFLNVGPRFGFAYDVTGHGKTVVRGGFGVMFNPIFGDAIIDNILNDPLTPDRVQLSRAELDSFGISYPHYNEDVLPLVRGGIAVPSYRVINPQLRSPYGMQFSLSVQQAILNTVLLETSFVGNRGVKQFMERAYNTVDRVTGLRPNPTIGTANYWDNSDSFHYYSWQTSLRKRYTTNLAANVHYTWGKIIAYGGGVMGGAALQDFFDLRSNRGPGEFDMRHVLSCDWIYYLPRLTSSAPAVQWLLGGWQLTGILNANSGRPINVNQPGSLDDQRVDLVSMDFLAPNPRETLQYLNPDAFKMVPIIEESGAPERPGTLGKFAIPGPGAWQVDASIGKSFNVAEPVTMLVRLEMINAFNHTIFNRVETNPESSRFGTFNRAADARRLQFGLRLTF